MSETTKKCNAPRICEWCDHGGSVTIFHAAPVFCNLRKEIKKYDQTCPDWKLIFSNEEVGGNKMNRPTPDIESPEKPWQGKLSHSRGPSDDWGTIRDERQNAIIRVPITLDEEKLVEHRRAGTDPAQQIVDEILNRINSYEETKRQLDEAERKLSRIYRWVEKHNQDGFIDSLTHVQNIDLCFDSLYDKLEIAERQKNRAIKHLAEMEKTK
jgi:hypothetical protein